MGRLRVTRLGIHEVLSGRNGLDLHKINQEKQFNKASHMNANAVVLAQVDWRQLFPLLLEAFQLLRQEDKDWQAIIQVGMKLLALIMQAEQSSGVKADWESLWKMLLPILLELISRIGQPKQ